MSPPPDPRPPGFSRRTLLAASAAGVALLVAGCTSGSSTDERDKVTSEQADDLAAQVAVQQRLVAAFTAAGAADAGLAAAVADLADQAGEQLDRLRAAVGSTASDATQPATPGPDPRSWLREQVAATATSHATACLEQTGARAALLGSIAAGLRGQDGRLA